MPGQSPMPISPRKKDFNGKESLILDNLLLIGIRCIHVYDHMSKLNAFLGVHAMQCVADEAENISLQKNQISN